MDVREVIKGIRRSKNMTQEQFSKEIGVSRSYLNDVENARKNPSIKTIEKLANKMGMTTKEFFGVSVKSDLKNFSTEELMDELSERGIIIQCNCNGGDSNGN